MFNITQFKDFDNIPSAYHLAVKKCVENDLLQGSANGNFEPNGLINIAQMCKIVTLLLNRVSNPIMQPIEDYFDSSQKKHWAAAYIQYCKHQKLYPFKDTLNWESFVTVNDANEIGYLIYIFLCDLYSIKHRSVANSFLSQQSDTNISRSKLCKLIIDTLCKFWSSVFENFTPTPYNSTTISHYIQMLLEEHSSFPFLTFDSAYFIKCLTKQSSPTVVPLVQIRAIFKLQKLKEDFFCVDLPNSVFHFTNIRTLSILSSQSSKLHLTNSAFLNDPSEGIIARNHLKKYLKEHANISPEFSSIISGFLNSTSNTIPISNTYIASFNRNLDNTTLPMWYQYGDKGNGCCIEFLTKYFSVSLYKVIYIEENSVEFNAFFDSVLNIISNTLKDSDLKNDFFISFIHSFLEQITFLFKDICYAHEKEVRAIVSCEPQNANKEPEPRPGEYFLRTFCESDYKIHSVTFGPKVQNIKQLIVGCASNGLVCSFKHSSLPFQ